MCVDRRTQFRTQNAKFSAPVKKTAFYNYKNNGDGVALIGRIGAWPCFGYAQKG